MDTGPKSIFSEASRPKKYILSICIYYGTFAMGISMTYLNPTALDFSNKLNESIDVISYVFMVITAGYLLGALSAGVLLNYVQRLPFCAASFVFQTLPFFAIPYAESVVALFSISFFLGYGGGCYDAAQVAWIIDIWRHESPPFILIAHFAYSVGTLVPPLILGPYLSEEKEETTEGPITTTTTESTTQIPYESQLATPFFIGGALVFIALIIQIGLNIAFRPKKDIVEEIDMQNTVDLEVKNEKISIEGTTDDNGNFKRKILLVVLCCCIIGFYQGLELCTGQFIPTFSHFSEVGLSEREGAAVAFRLSLGFVAGRLAGIILVLKVAPHFLISGNFILLLLSNIILLVWAGSSVTWLYIGSVAIGLGMSTVYPALYAYIEKYLFITDSIAATVAVNGGLVSAIYPIIVGKSVEKHPEVMTYVNFFSIFVCVVAFSTLFYVTHVRAAKAAKKSENAKK